MKQMIWITTQFEGYHSWPEAPEKVEFLRQLHRHVFHVKVYIQTSGDRGIEFFLFKRDVEFSVKMIHKRDMGSCEQIALDLHKDILGRYDDKYGGREIWIKVSEDKENGVLLTFKPK